MIWTFANIWNESIAVREERELKERDYMWASELGSSFIDRYYKMKGYKPTNPPNQRAMRKFGAGNIWEYVVYMVLERAGLIISAQEHLAFQYPGLLKVTGKLDFLVGGVPDLERAQAAIENMNLPPMLKDISIRIIANIKTLQLTELKPIVLEVKSCSAMMWPKYEYSQRPADNHSMQNFYYLKAKGMDEGHVVYINKDDCMLLEFPIYNPGFVEKMYKEDITTMTDYWESGEVPKKPEEVIFDTDTFNFRKNWQIEYSPFLTMLYGYERGDIFAERWDSSVKGWNRVYKRCVNGDKLTAANQEIISDAKRTFFNWDELVEMGRLNKDRMIPEETES